MNSKDAKIIAIAYKKISDSFMSISKELEKIEKITTLATQTKVTSKTSKKTSKKTTKKNQEIDPLIQELKEARELAKKALEE